MIGMVIFLDLLESKNRKTETNPLISTGATVMKIDTKDPKEVPQELDIALDLEYSGGCHIAMQVDLVFNKSVYLAVKLVHLQGRARLQFRRHPLAHWSFAFYEVMFETLIQVSCYLETRPCLMQVYCKYFKVMIKSKQ